MVLDGGDGGESSIVGDFDGIDDDLRVVLSNLKDIDKWEMRRLLREEGILVRLRPREVVPK